MVGGPQARKKFPTHWKFSDRFSAWNLRRAGASGGRALRPNRFAYFGRELAAKHNGMSDLFSAKTNSFRHPPAHPLTGREMLAKLRTALARERGYRMTYQRLGKILGKATSTAGFWFGIFDSPHVLAWVCLLERLSDEERQRFLRSVCRPLPSVLHPRLAHATATVAHLLETLQNPCGLTLVRGSAGLRSYFISALGHTFPQLHPRHHMAVGLDVFPPDCFVPVESLTYLRAPLAPDALRAAITAAWPKIQRASAALVLLNGVWSAAPSLREAILAEARSRHVILADEVLPDFHQLQQRGLQPLQLLTLSQGPNGARIQVLRESWKPARRPAKNRR